MHAELRSCDFALNKVTRRNRVIAIRHAAMCDSLPNLRPLLERYAAHRDHCFDHRVGVNPVALVDVADS